MRESWLKIESLENDRERQGKRWESHVKINESHEQIFIVVWYMTKDGRVMAKDEALMTTPVREE